MQFEILNAKTNLLCSLFGYVMMVQKEHFQQSFWRKAKKESLSEPKCCLSVCGTQVVAARKEGGGGGGGGGGGENFFCFFF